jgi:hypothetical protein
VLSSATTAGAGCLPRAEPAPRTEKLQVQGPGRQGLRGGAELRLRAVLQEQEKLSGRQGLKAGAE